MLSVNILPCQRLHYTIIAAIATLQEVQVNEFKCLFYYPNNTLQLYN